MRIAEQCYRGAGAVVKGEFEESLAYWIASAAVEAMLFEVSATPKPGLVDRDNCGAHDDMDYFTFMTSAAALHSSFDEMVRAGIRCQGKPVTALLPELRHTGVQAERNMFSRTEGINTHKGMIFTLGLLCGCAGWNADKGVLDADTLCLLAAEMCQGICTKEYANLEQKIQLTKGERMYLKYGCKGVRGEVESGYHTVRAFSLPVYRELRSGKNDVSVNDALVQTLLHLIAETVDTNIISRHDWETAEYARRCAADVLQCGGILTEQGRTMLGRMDEDFIKRWISPGGCADLLAVTHFLYTLEHDKIRVRDVKY